MAVDDAGHDRARELRDMSPAYRSIPQLNWPQFARNLLENRRSESMADPKLVNRKPHDECHCLPISVRTA
jgi:hypothetical protein